MKFLREGSHALLQRALAAIRQHAETCAPAVFRKRLNRAIEAAATYPAC